MQFHPRLADEGAAAAPGGGSLIPPGGGGSPPLPRPRPPPVLGRDLAVVAAPSPVDLGMLILMVCAVERCFIKSQSTTQNERNRSSTQVERN